MSKLIDAVHDLSNVATDVHREMHAIARAFEAIGNTTHADRLIEWADEILVEVKKVNEAFGQDLTERVVGAQETSAAMLKSVLVGIDIGKGVKVIER